MGAAFRRKYFDLSTELADKLASAARDRGMSQSALVRAVLESALAKDSQPAKKGKK